MKGLLDSMRTTTSFAGPAKEGVGVARSIQKTRIINYTPWSPIPDSVHHFPRPLDLETLYRVNDHVIHSGLVAVVVPEAIGSSCGADGTEGVLGRCLRN
jgi:hypothetical protein